MKNNQQTNNRDMSARIYFVHTLVVTSHIYCSKGLFFAACSMIDTGSLFLLFVCSV